MEFIVEPYQGVGPLDWKMGPEEVAQILGSASRQSKNRAGNLVEFRNDLMLSCIYDKSSKLLVEAGFSKLENVVFFDGMDLLASAAIAVARFLEQHDSTARQGFGSQVFPLLGISLTGFVPEEAEVKAVTAFARGRWEGPLQSMEKLSLP